MVLMRAERASVLIRGGGKQGGVVTGEGDARA